MYHALFYFVLVVIACFFFVMWHRCYRTLRRSEVTNLPNRHALSEQRKKYEKGNRYYTIVFIDLDGFKEVNDTHGHAVGDRILQKVGEILTAHVREGDFVAHLSGDEYVVILRGLFTNDAPEVINRAADAVTRELAEYNISFTYGIASSNEGFTSFTEIFKEADVRMNKAKEAKGRRR